MQFRERRRVIQVIRTVYDPAIKRGKSEVVGRLAQDAPVIDDELRQSCTAEELCEVEEFLVQMQLRQSREGAKEAGGFRAFRIPAIRSTTTNECSASSRRRIVHGQIEGP